MDFWSTLLIIGAFGAITVAARKLFKLKQVLSAARRMELRDKGYVEEDGKGVFWIHTLCNGRIRIGINAQGEAVPYCWRCECVIDDDTGDGPEGDGESVPDTPGTDSETSEKVTHIARWKKRA